MAGLLGDGWEDPRSAAMMALSGGLLRGDFGGGLLGANAAYGNSQNDAMKRQFLQAQMAEAQAQAEQRKQQTMLAQRQQEMQNQFLYGGGSPMGGSGGSASPQGAGMAGGAPGGAGGVLALSQRLGIPPEAIQADVVFNGGKKISELLAKHGARDMQVSNGYAYDRNQLGAGFMPQMNVSNDGKSTMVRIGPDGLPVVQAPRGALDTYAGYQNVQEGTRANYDVMPVTPAGQPPQMTTRGALATNPQVQGRITPAMQAARDVDRGAILQQELTKAKTQLQAALSVGDMSAAARAQADIASLNREIGGRSASVGMPLQSPEEALRATKGVEADTARNTAVAGDAQKSKDTLSNIARARELLKQGPTSSGIGSVVDSALSLGGVSTKGADVAAQLDTLSGWMVANVPRMEGPQSNFDVQNYKTMAGLVGDRTKPLSQRLAALQTLEDLQQKYAALNGGGNAVNSGGATGDFGAKPPPQPTPGMVRGGYRFKGGDPADKNSWERM
jgi:hypothetical protein